ncbi:HTH-type transcriptional regulator CysL [Fundidesulfovibrio magnetotacticus]|uniref:HTH-type transcriptional regulator CysL n=1 Tax=Fundidesulfovibrio magnetotacticus TaxID=2730080 RepID=A0A6V8LZL0_9BACT|nr:selenium metabolism-associated LysR family transcriptional regulator [Fundidesulfovibrio magnetotacticus]GFK95658.1 HTH-type transcriptional regulator CysL [Fundidesulfovibrio magnetotacticus]
MDIRRLEAFRKVYELGSFSKAGQGLFLSQPTISAHVLSLEQELGTQLFDRLGRTILPTQAGEILYRHVLQVFSALETARAEVELLQQKVAGELLIGGSTIPATYLLPERLAEFSRRYPDVRVRLTVGDSQDIIGAVARGELALGVVGLAVSDPELVFTPFIEDELSVLGSRKLPGLQALCDGGTPSIAVEDLRNWPWVMREHGSGTRKAFELALGAAGQDIRTLNTVIEARSHEAVVQCALHGLGLCVSSKLAVAPCMAKGNLIQVSVSGLTMQRSFHMVRHAKRHVFPAMRYFMDYLNTVAGA